ncbi:DUF1524 domain-containing protein, partial [Sutterella sp.]|uniref:GmrSD restriction endonuclease domain-containing protein n=1 Tax=Sutterella sp. TaxID=1981025 RepID=UPI0026DEACB5
KVPSLDIRFDIEHIYSRRRAEEARLQKEGNIDSLGNKSLLEKSINIRASDYRFEDKKKHYLGTEVGNRARPGTVIRDLTNIAKAVDFTESDIISRTERIIDAFMDELAANNLLQ